MIGRASSFDLHACLVTGDLHTHSPLIFGLQSRSLESRCDFARSQFPQGATQYAKHLITWFLQLCSTINNMR